MSIHKSCHVLHTVFQKKSMVKNPSKSFNSAVVLSIAVLGTSLVSVTGCSTTQEFRPTASVMVGAHKSL